MEGNHSHRDAKGVDTPPYTRKVVVPKGGDEVLTRIFSAPIFFGFAPIALVQPAAYSIGIRRWKMAAAGVVMRSQAAEVGITPQLGNWERIHRQARPKTRLVSPMRGRSVVGLLRRVVVQVGVCQLAVTKSFFCSSPRKESLEPLFAER
jgi:hypothetical protein